MAAGPAAAAEVTARDAFIAWCCSEFAAANSIIDALCEHIVQITDDGVLGEEYESVFGAINRRRINWFPLLRFQKFFPISDVIQELYRVAAARAEAAEAATYFDDEPVDEAITGEEKAADEDAVDTPGEGSRENIDAAREELDGEYSSGDSSERKETEYDGGADGRSQGEHSSYESFQICSDHNDCFSRPERIKTLKGFSAKESVNGHMVNIVKGLKIFEDVFSSSELHKLSEFVYDLRQAGRNGELSGETFIFFNKQMKGDKREIIQFGVPLFEPTSEETYCSIEPIPMVLQAVIDHLILWRLLPETRKPNCCIINFFDEEEYSQPFFKPPHLDNPISTLVLSETPMAFGRALVSDQDGNYKAPLTLSLKEGSLVVMRRNSADMARHVVCASSNRRVCITFIRVGPSAYQNTNISFKMPSPTKAANTVVPTYSPPHAVMPSTWGMAIPAPFVMFAAPAPPPISDRSTVRSGTGVFLPWSVATRKYNKHLPPRIQKRRFASLTSTIEAHG